MLDARLDPVAWDPPEPPEMEGPLAENDALTDAERAVELDGPEDVAFDETGRLWAGDRTGRIHRTVEPVGGEDTGLATEAVAEVPGRPLAVEFRDEDLLVASIGAGLLSVGRDGEVDLLVDRAGGREVVFADDIHVLDDGTVYLTDASEHEIYQDELLELRDTGRLLRYDPETGETDVVLADLGFANGLAPGPDGESLVLTETSRFRVTRYWHDGERAGEAERIATNLPGYPDNVDAAGDGTYWVAIPALRDPTLDWLQRHPWLVRQFSRLPDWTMERVTPDPYGLVLRMDADGEILGSHHDPTGRVFYVTSATPRGGDLYLGTLEGDCVWRHDPGED
jgi:sugar lactone lactonase YvrE